MLHPRYVDIFFSLLQLAPPLLEGAVLTGIVKNLTDYGAFIDLGGIDGLLHITDMSWGRVGHPSEMLNVGDELRVIVLKFDPATERVSLGLKQIQEDPWAHAAEKYPPGTRVTGKVVSLTDYGNARTRGPADRYRGSCCCRG